MKASSAIFYAIPWTLAEAKNKSTTAFVPSALTYLLPYPFVGFKTSESDFAGNGSTSEGFVDTKVPNSSSASAMLGHARESAFVSYSTEFDALLGLRPTLSLIESKHSLFAAEAGAWIPTKNEVWFTSSTYEPPSYVTVFNLVDLSLRSLVVSGVPLVNPNGGTFSNNFVYFTTWGNSTYPGGIVAVDPGVGSAVDVINNYFGERLNGPDDLAWATKQNANSIATSLPNTVYRYNPQDQSVVPVISRADVETPNGIQVDPTQNILYVTDAPFPSTVGVSTGKGTPAIYAFDIMNDGTILNKRLVGQPRVGIADGLKIDLDGRIWTAEGEGIVVRSPLGKVLGLFNAQAILDPKGSHPIANFALAGDTLVILAGNRLYTVKLAERVSEQETHS